MNLKTKEITICAMFAALIAIGAFIKIDIPLPMYTMHFTFQWFFVLMEVSFPKRAGISVHRADWCSSVCSWRWTYLYFPPGIWIFTELCAGGFSDRTADGEASGWQGAPDDDTGVCRDACILRCGSCLFLLY